ncbi:universal stress protein [Acidiluteibacter ferrifornacis]|uniref:Universal stress protein n=1 Tax=Acidiluteibacter ferrifornacis TaxID=2692424 RepID=A0A6N9NJJ5_9FLAO|nr:universal stress protein [Acidiluteibacter ferrifornacis]MBR9830799.1 universal stress protein [bacterium]NBG64825.1 universal stress protein [Acidiluteibacter ferrifornacis]
MSNSIYKVLVPTDFTDVAKTAINHAAMVAKSFDGEVHLLHVVSSDKALSAAKDKLDAWCQEAYADYGVTTKYVVKKGSIFEDIGQVAEEIGAMLIIMGTHGVKGLQHITGSHALKVINNSKVPFVIVQRKTAKGLYKQIVLPIRFAQETKQKLSITTSIAKHFGSTVHIFASNESDEFLRTKVNRELTFAKHYLDERKIPYVVEVAPSTTNYLQQVISYSKEVDADIIAIVNSKEGGILPDLFKGGGEQEVIGNKEEIPVIIMNPTQEFVPESFG